MKVSKNFVKVFLALFLVVIVGNIIGAVLGVWNQWYGWSFLGLLVVLFFLIFRKNKVGFIKVLAWALPVLLILAVLYVNFPIFGFEKEYSIQVLEDGSVVASSGLIYFEDSKGKKISNLSDVYSLGAFNLVVEPKVVLRNAVVNASISGEDVYFAKTDFDPLNHNWDYFWDFTQGIPSPLQGNAKFREDLGCVYFNGSNNETLFYPNSSDMFENDSFVVYVEWMPEDSFGVNQQLIGHFNWEVWNHNTTIRFMTGRLENSNGGMPVISKQIDENFFNETHSVIAVYKADKKGFGFTDLFIDSEYISRQRLTNETIWKDYNADKNLSFGFSPHNYGKNDYFTGCIYQAGFDFTELSYLDEIEFQSEDKKIVIPIVGTGNLTEIKVEVRK